MDPVNFYGTSRHVAVLADDLDSVDEDLSDDDQEYLPPKKVMNLVTGTVDDDYASDESDDDDVQPSTSTASVPSRPRAKPKAYPRWKEGFLIRDATDISFKGDSTLPDSITELETPLQFFKYMFPDNIVKFICTETNLYALTSNLSRPPPEVLQSEMQQFLGIVMYMSIIQLPSTRDYWSPTLGHPMVSEIMSCNRFEEIKRSLHFNDNSRMPARTDPDFDKLYKIRPLLQQMREILLKVPKEEMLCVDEQIIPFKGKISIKQYNPKKPHKWGYKVFVLSGVSGFSYDFEVFTGGRDNVVAEGEPNLGASSNVVIRMSRSIPRNMNHHLFFDNWFTSVQLQVYLTNEGVLPLGTVRRNRLPGVSFPSEKEMKVKGRGSFVEKICKVEGVQLSAIAWYDNKIVHLLSSFVGSQPTTTVKRFFGAEVGHKMIPCPKAIEVYNTHMGGVDLLDSILGYYRIKIRSKKWYLRIFFHFIDLAVVNAWLLYRRSGKNQMPLKDFKAEIASGLCKQGKDMIRKRGRPSSEIEENLQATNKRRTAVKKTPTIDIRKDGVGHWPEWLPTRQRCKLPNCKGFTFVSCSKCNTSLCFNKDKNCFNVFHLN